MAGQFQIKNVFTLGGAMGLVGEVRKGKIQEGDMGTTWENKRFKVIKINSSSGSQRQISSGSEATIVVRNVGRGDVTPGDVIFID